MTFIYLCTRKIEMPAVQHPPYATTRGGKLGTGFQETDLLV